MRAFLNSEMISPFYLVGLFLSARASVISHSFSFLKLASHAVTFSREPQQLWGILL